MLARRIALVALALTVAVGLVGMLATAEGKRAKRTCSLKKSKTLQKNRSARVYTRTEVRDTLEGKALYGCHLRTKKRVFLAITGQYDPDKARLKLRGRYVAVNYTSTDRANETFGWLRLWDLKRPKRLRNVSDVEATDIEIGPRGALAWIGRPWVNTETQPPLSVRIVDRGGDRTVATGAIERKSLTIRGSTVHWRQDGVARSAELKP